MYGSGRSIEGVHRSFCCSDVERHWVALVRAFSKMDKEVLCQVQQVLSQC